MSPRQVGIFNPTSRERLPASSQASAGGALLPPSNADDDLSLYSRLEREPLLLAAGNAADFESTARRHNGEFSVERLWRVMAMILPPYP